MSDQSVTELLQRWSNGDDDAVVGRLYADLRRIARNQMRREEAGHTLQPTALVHEAWVRLLRQDDASWESREQFLAVAARVMRRILVDHARRRQSAKRGGGDAAVPLKEVSDVLPEPPAELLALDEALSDLSALSPDRARIVELR